MRTALFGILALSLAACGQQQTESASAENGCALSATHELNWSSDTQSDIVTATAHGPSCGQAIVTLVVRNAAGDPLWTLSRTYLDMVAGGGGPGAPPPVSDEEMQRFLDGWVDLSLGRSSELPAWTESAATLGDAVQGMSYATNFDRDTYEMLRASNLPQICYAAATEGSECLIIDPASHTPAMIVAFGP